MSVAIIGAGACGLVALKEALAHGIKPVCYEMDGDIGGMWNIDRNTYSTVYESTIINTSKEMMCFSDFPMPKEFPSYCPHHKVLEYFHLYCDNFELRKYIAFEHRVDLIEKQDDFDVTGDWKLTITDLNQNKAFVQTFNFVLVCNGHHSVPYIPQIPGHNLFNGNFIHSRDYFRNNNYVDKTVIVIGVGNSGCDMAVDLSRVCKQVYLVTGKGVWVLPRLHAGSLPFDMLFSRFMQNIVPRYLAKSYVRSLIYNRTNLDFYGLTPNHDVLSCHPTVNDDLIGRIAVGAIKVKPSIKSISETGAVFMDGTSVNADTIAYCTGFSISFPFLAPGILNVSDNHVDLYKYVFPPHLKGTLAVLGCIQPIGAINPVAELQARWAMAVFKKEKSLPTQQQMEREIETKKRLMDMQFVKSRRHTIQVDYTHFCDEISSLIGVKPKFIPILFSDPRLFISLLFGPTTPPQYRLHGPHKWSGARNSIIHCWDNTIYPSQTRILHSKPHFVFLRHLILVVIAMAVLSYFLVCLF